MPFESSANCWGQVVTKVSFFVVTIDVCGSSRALFLPTVQTDEHLSFILFQQFFSIK